MKPKIGANLPELSILGTRSFTELIFLNLVPASSFVIITRTCDSAHFLAVIDKPTHGGRRPHIICRIRYPSCYPGAQYSATCSALVDCVNNEIASVNYSWIDCAVYIAGE